jgi:predicted RNA binding protein YcfA (HicA-like mRNA interferase family)
MKRIGLIKKLTAIGCLLVRHDGKHDWYRNPTTGALQPVPRHRQINEKLAKHIIKILSPPSVNDPSDKGEGRKKKG